ncbi:DUF2267 domain-containing protein [Haloterrigena salifodinae]|uniref:DUF2267 domain-containing protein n=1 Tax=Haloterrigena salifodinae TaxID=2675099 RepID=UPI000F884363|nr:DUF2267 domain-containing protein [Haloterrigena salifodinae]
MSAAATLGETLTGGEAEDVAAQLPDELAWVLEDADHDGAGYDRGAFVDRVGEHLRDIDVEPDDAEQFAEAVTDAVAAALTGGEVRDLMSQLDDDLHPLFEDVTVHPDQL